jgi:uncharacterized phiE125 gp8 family phage protein
MFKPVLVTAPSLTMVSLAEAKAHCKVDFSDDDALITSLIQAATSYLDGYSGVLGRALLPQTWRQDYDGFYDVMRLPVGPVQSVTSVIYQDVSGGDQTLNASQYVLLTDDYGAYVQLSATGVWPNVGTRADAVRITYLAGSAAVIPAIRMAALLLIGHWYANREAVVTGTISGDLLLGVDALIAPYRIMQP